MVRRYTTRRSTYRRRPYRRTRTTRTARTYRKRRPIGMRRRVQVKNRKINSMRRTGIIRARAPGIPNLPTGDSYRLTTVNRIWEAFSMTGQTGERALSARTIIMNGFDSQWDQQTPGLQSVANYFTSCRVVSTTIKIRLFAGNPINTAENSRVAFPVLIAGISGLPAGTSQPAWRALFPGSSGLNLSSLPEEQPHTTWRTVTNSSASTNSVIRLQATYNSATAYGRNTIRTAEDDLLIYNGNTSTLFNALPNRPCYAFIWCYGPYPLSASLITPATLPFQVTLKHVVEFSGRIGTIA
nr:capsid protein [Tick-associated circular DNA virus]